MKFIINFIKFIIRWFFRIIMLFVVWLYLAIVSAMCEISTFFGLSLLFAPFIIISLFALYDWASNKPKTTNKN